MKVKKTFAVFGLGRYGLAVAKELVESGAEVLAVDSNEDIVNNVSVTLPVCKCADITDSDVMKQLGISNIDIVIIAMAGNLEASVMAVTLCKELGVKTVIVKCANEMHCKIMKRVGADKVVIPETESGIRLARNLLSSGFIDIIELAKNISIAELEVRSEWIGKSILELNLRKKYSINIVAIKTNKGVTTDIDPQNKLEKEMKLIVIANTAKLDKLN